MTETLVPATSAETAGAHASSGADRASRAQSAGVNPIAVIALAFVLGVVLARWLDWSDRARAGV
jgi:hypothetical protein